MSERRAPARRTSEPNTQSEQGEQGGFSGYDGPGQQSSDAALLETLVLEAPVAFAFYDTEFRYRRINRRLADINRLPMAAHIGHTPSEVLPADLGRAIEARLRQVLVTGQTVTDDDFTVPSASGELLHFQSQWFPAPGLSGEVIGVAVLVVDITERRRQQDALTRSNARTAKLQRATAALAEALTVADVRRVMADLGAESVGAEATEVVLTADGARPTPPHPRDVVLPLTVSGGPIGQLRLRLATPPDHDDEPFLGALAGQCAIGLERARLYERERNTAATLQRSLLPDRLPVVPGLELSARFRSGSPEADVGGDWYDAFTVPGGHVVLVVGDVMGKGVIAAAGMGRLRSALRALAHVDPRPAAVLTGLDRVFGATEDPDQIATLVYLLVDPVAGRVTVGGAGHLPLLLRRAGAAPELVDAGSGSTPLGWPEPRHQRTLDLGRGDLLLGLTDGLVERRDFDLDQGLAEMMAVVADSSGTLDQLTERVSTALMADTRGRDDATVLAVRLIA